MSFSTTTSKFERSGSQDGPQKSGNRRRRRQQKRIPTNRMKILLMIPDAMESIFCGYRCLDGIKNLLKLRLVCRTWSFEILRLSEEVWIRWMNPKVYFQILRERHSEKDLAQKFRLGRWYDIPYYVSQPSSYPSYDPPGNKVIETVRKLKVKENLSARVFALQQCENLEHRKALLETSVPIEILHCQSELPKHNAKTFQSYPLQVCKNCNGKGQGRSPHCFQCIPDYKVKNRKKYGAEAAKQIRQASRRYHDDY